LRDALRSDRPALAAWEDITPLARNEWICWTISVKRPKQGESMSSGPVRCSKKASADRAAGPAVRIADMSSAAAQAVLVAA
jgi:hypothetical protein